MHRSGTTLLVRLLERCGVFMGAQQTRNGESIFFQNINKEILDLFGCSWRCLDFLPDPDKMQRHFKWLYTKVDRYLKSGLIYKYWGLIDSLRLLRTPSLSWGWKDPRNSLTLQIWQRIFPSALIVHIIRDGRDVALSLLQREIKRESGKDIFNEIEKRSRFIEYLSLWESYIQNIKGILPLFKNPYTIKYEQLLSTPLQELKTLLLTLNISFRGSLNDVISIVDSSRANHYTHIDIPWARGLADTSPLLKDLGYI